MVSGSWAAAALARSTARDGHQLLSPSRVISSGRIMIRMTTASSRTATARPNPVYFISTRLTNMSLMPTGVYSAPPGIRRFAEQHDKIIHWPENNPAATSSRWRSSMR